MPKPSSASSLQPHRRLSGSLDGVMDGGLDGLRLSGRCSGGNGMLGGRPGAGGRTTTSAAAPARISNADGADLGSWTNKLSGGVVGE